MRRLDHDPMRPLPWIRGLWRPMVLGGLSWLAVVGVPARPASAQDPPAPSGWNDVRARDLMARALVRRGLPLADSALLDYRADARGMVYFYLDSRELGEKVLVKTDQVALEVMWAQPDRAKQRIVGLRDESRLPNRMVYHLDHLTVVQNGFGDAIRLGDGDEVRDVPHPASSGADTVYDFRLADSLTIRLPGRADPVLAYEVEVRPRHMDRPALIGSVFVDRATADIVRMTFTFTPASYVDRRLDYINISLDNILWDGRYWLPYEQAVEIRRQVPELDYAAAAVILARFRVTDYLFNVGLEDSVFHGYQVTALPRHQRETFPFEAGLYDDLRAHGLEPPAGMAAVRRHAASLVGSRDLSGLPRWRLSIPDPSSVLRFNRAEGVFIGAGVAYVPSADRRLRVQGGYASGTERPFLHTSIRATLGPRVSGSVDVGWNGLRDMGPRPAMPGSLNTLTAAFGEDHLDPFHASGVSVALERGSGEWTGGVRIAAERHRPAVRVVASTPLSADEFRLVKPVARGDLFSAELSLRRITPFGANAPGWSGTIAVEAGAFDSQPFARPNAEVIWLRQSRNRSADVRLRFAAGASPGGPLQKLFLVGGANTLPGYDHRTFVGDVFALADAELSTDLHRPWVRGRLLLAAGYSDLVWYDDPAPGGGPGISPTRDWLARTTGGIRPSVGAGVGLFFDILRVDVARGLDGGRWQLLVSAHPDLWPIL